MKRCVETYLRSAIRAVVTILVFSESLLLWKNPYNNDHWVFTSRTFPAPSRSDMPRPDTKSVSSATLTSCL